MVEKVKGKQCDELVFILEEAGVNEAREKAWALVQASTECV